MSTGENYPIPEDEEERLEALKRYEILDTPPEDSFDRITGLASHVFDVSISMLTLLDSERQWFKSCVGVDRRQTDRGLAFCNYPVVSKETLVVPDAARDDRFKDNSLVTGEMNIRAYAGAPLLTEDNHVLGTLCVIDTEPREFEETEIELLEDLAEEAYAQLELHRQRDTIKQHNQKLALLENAVSATREGIMITDPSLEDNPIIFVNEAFLEITGYSRDEVLGRNCRFLQGEQTDPEKAEEIRRAIDNQKPVTVRILNYRKDGESFWNKVSITPIRNEAGEVTHYVGVQQDVTKYKEIEEKLEHEATYDRLTELLNRKTLLKRMRDEIDRNKRYGNNLSFVLIDLDHFKDINDNYGHRTGDRVLQSLGSIISEHVRKTDIPGRYGGEEFGILLPETDLESAKLQAERLRQKIQDHTIESTEGGEFSITASLGISCLDENDDTFEDLIERADSALYDAKGEGRNRVRIVSP